MYKYTISSTVKCLSRNCSYPQYDAYIDLLVVYLCGTIHRAEAARCVEHQFRCLNSSECIAIYDVCNGIPQCADGSDEAETLDCHSRDRQRMLKQPVELTDNQIYEIVRPLQVKNNIKID